MSEHVSAESDEGPVIFARAISHDGSTRAIGWDHVREWRPTQEENLLWVHLNRSAEGVSEWLRDDLELAEATIGAITSNQNRPRAFREGNALATILRGINGDEGAEADDMGHCKSGRMPTTS